MAPPATASLLLPDLLPPCDEVARALGAETEMEPDERIERMTDLSNTPTQIFMPPNWEPLDGTIPVDQMAEPDDVEYVRKDIADAAAQIAYIRGLEDAVRAVKEYETHVVAWIVSGKGKVAPTEALEQAIDAIHDLREDANK